MTRMLWRHPVALALYANAAVMLLVGLSWRSGGKLENVALGQLQAPIAGGAGLFVVPAQFSTNTWGCYVMDVDTQVLCAYQYYPGDKMLRLIAARNFRHDRKLERYNTTPSPEEVADLVARQKQPTRGATQTAPPSPETPRDNP